MSQPSVKSSLRTIAAVSALFFVGTFALVPLYYIACEKVFGIKLETGPAGEQQVAGMVEQKDRTITVQFDATVNSKLVAKLDPLFPAKTRELNWLLCETLVFLQSPTVAAKGIALIAATIRSVAAFGAEPAVRSRLNASTICCGVRACASQGVSVSPMVC